MQNLDRRMKKKTWSNVYAMGRMTKRKTSKSKFKSKSKSKFRPKTNTGTKTKKTKGGTSSSSSSRLFQSMWTEWNRLQPQVQTHIQSIYPQHHNRSDIQTKIIKQSVLWSTLPRLIQQHVQNHIQYGYTFTIPNESWTFTFGTENPCTPNTLSLWMHRILLFWFYIRTKATHTPTCSDKTHPIHCFLLMTSLKKEFPSSHTKHSVLGLIHVNTAFTTICEPNSNQAEILLFREEEWFKVFIHETMHLFGLDFSNMDHALSNSYQDGWFRCLRGLDSTHTKNKTKLETTEAYTECWARILHCALDVYLDGHTSSLSPTSFISKVQASIQQEQQYSLYQANRVLQYMHFTWNQLIQPQAHEWKEQSNVFAYYVMACLCFYHYDTFIHMYPTIQFPHTKQGLQLWQQWVCSLFLSYEHGQLDVTSTSLFSSPLTLRMTYNRSDKDD